MEKKPEESRRENQTTSNKESGESNQSQATQHAKKDLTRLLASSPDREHTYALPRHISDTLQSASDVVLSEKEKESESALINHVQDFIYEYKKLRTVHDELYHIMNLYHTGEKIIRGDNPATEKLEHIQKQIKQSLKDIDNLRQNEHFSNNDFQKIAKDQIAKLEEKQKAIEDINTEGLKDHHQVLEGYMKTFSQEAKEKLVKVLQDSKNQNLAQLEKNLEDLSKQLSIIADKELAKQYFMHCLETEHRYALPQWISDTLQSISDVFLSEQERKTRDAKNMMLDCAKNFIDEYKNFKSLQNKLYHLINLYDADKRILEDDSAGAKKLEHIQTLKVINELRQDKDFPQRDFTTFANNQMAKLARAVQEYEQVETPEDLKDYYTALKDYINIFFNNANKEKEEFIKVLNNEYHNNSLTQVQCKLESLSDKIDEQLFKAVENDYNKACKYRELHKEEIQIIENFEPVTDFDKSLELVGHTLEEVKKEEDKSANLLTKTDKSLYKAVKSSNDDLSNKLEKLNKYLDIRSEIERMVTAIISKKEEVNFYNKLPREIYGSREKLFLEQIDSSIKQAKNFLGKEEATSEELLKTVQDLADQEMALTEKIKVFEKSMNRKVKGAEFPMDSKEIQKNRQDRLDFKSAIIAAKAEIRKATLYIKFSKRCQLSEEPLKDSDLTQIKHFVEQADAHLEKDYSDTQDLLEKLNNQKKALGDKIATFEGEIESKPNEEGLQTNFKATWENFKARSELISVIGTTEQCYEETFAYWNKYKKEINKGDRKVHNFNYQLQKISHDLKEARQYMKHSESIDLEDNTSLLETEKEPAFSDSSFQISSATEELQQRARYLETDYKALFQEFGEVQKYINARLELESTLEDIKETVEDTFSFHKIYEEYKETYHLENPPLSQDDLKKLNKSIYDAETCLENDGIGTDELSKSSEELTQLNATLASKLTKFEISLDNEVQSKIKQDSKDKIERIYEDFGDFNLYYIQNKSKIIEEFKEYADSISNYINKVSKEITEAHKQTKDNITTIKELLPIIRYMEAQDTKISEKRRSLNDLISLKQNSRHNQSWSEVLSSFLHSLLN